MKLIHYKYPDADLFWKLGSQRNQIKITYTEFCFLRLQGVKLWKNFKMDYPMPEEWYPFAHFKG